MLASAALFLALTQAKLPTYEQVLKNVHSAFAQLKGYRETWTMTDSEAKPEDGQMKLVRAIDGERGRMQAFDGNTLVIDTAANGKTTTMVAHAAKVYGQTVVKKAVKDEPFKMPSTDGIEEGNYSLVLDQVYAPMIVFKTTPKVRSLEDITVDGKPARLLQMTIEVKDRSEPTQVKMWFRQDKWIVTRVEMSAKQEGKEHLISLESKIEENVAFGPNDFTIDPKSYSGYYKINFGG